ncbi:MAG: hypothetical protein ABF969_01135 [Sporolactobacillus sp.]
MFVSKNEKLFCEWSDRERHEFVRKGTTIIMNVYEKLITTMALVSQEAPTQQTVYGQQVLQKTYQLMRDGRYTENRHKALILSHLSHPLKQVAARFGVSEGALAKARSRILHDLEDVLTPYFLPALDARDWKTAGELVRLAETATLTDRLLLPPFAHEVARRYDQAGQPGIQEVALHDCTDEMKLLLRYAMLPMMRRLAALDAASQQHLFFLMALLNGQRGTPADRFRLYRLVTTGKLPPVRQK